MGHENIGHALRDRVAEIVSDARRPSQRTGDIEARDYATADLILSLLVREPAPTPPTGDAAGIAGEIESIASELADVLDSHDCLHLLPGIRAHLDALASRLAAGADAPTGQAAGEGRE